MNPRITSEFGVKRQRYLVAEANGNGFTVNDGKRLNCGRCRDYIRRTDENHGHVPESDKRRRSDKAAELPAVSVALDGNGQRRKVPNRIVNQVLGQKNHSGACREGR